MNTHLLSLLILLTPCVTLCMELALLDPVQEDVVPKAPKTLRSILKKETPEPGELLIEKPVRVLGFCKTHASLSRRKEMSAARLEGLYCRLDRHLTRAYSDVRETNGGLPQLPKRLERTIYHCSATSTFTIGTAIQHPGYIHDYVHTIVLNVIYDPRHDAMKAQPIDINLMRKTINPQRTVLAGASASIMLFVANMLYHACNRSQDS